MKVTLIEFTRRARDLLIFSKRTRLLTSADAYQETSRMSEREKQEELEYVFSTISSSWEFIDYVFLIEKVTRAFTHQLVRHRVGTSFAQQSQRTVDMSEGFDYLASGACEDSDIYERAMDEIGSYYTTLIEEGIPPEDARGILPTNIATNILFKANLRTLSQMSNVRLCLRTQGEFQGVMRAIRKEVLAVHPWAEPVLQVYCVQWGACIFPRYGYTECPVGPALPSVDKDAIRKLYEKESG